MKKQFFGLTCFLVILVTTWVQADTITHSNTTINMDFVSIGDADNAADFTGYGAVDYEYRISQTEVTIAQFEASGVGSGNENYWDTGGYSVGSNAPAVEVSLYEAMQYCNYLTSGNVNEGLYEDQGGGVWSAKLSRAQVAAGTNQYYAVPTEDEWYKAAYYTGNSSDLWSLYAHGVDTDPVDVATANQTGWNYDGPNTELLDTWVAGGSAVEQNGTCDMMGNVWEWIDDPGGVIRGGRSTSSKTYLRSTGRGSGSPTGSFVIGFRVVSIGVRAIDTTIYTAVEIGWSAISGQTYQVQYSTNMISSNWFDLGESVIATNATSYMLDSTRSSSKRFYRVLESP